MIAAFPERLTARQIGFALLIVALAFILRVLVTVERAGGDPLFIPADGTDPATYLQQARGILDGTFPTAPFYFHPGPAYFFAALMKLVGDSVPVLLLVIALLDSLTAGLLIAAGWLLTRRAAGGYLAGSLYALYPLAIFYGTTALIAPQAAFMLTLLLLLMLWQRERVRWWRTILMGLAGGALVLLRLNLAPVLLLLGIWLLLLPHTRRQQITHLLTYAALVLLVIAPVTLHNYRSSGGKFIPVATTGELEIYLANNRDSNGQNPRTLATETLEIDYQSALRRDIQVAPEHFFGLLLYKFAVFWDAGDIGNNVSFADGQAASAVLRVLPLTFPLLAWLAFPALALLWQQDRRAALVFALIIASLCATFLLVFVFGRLRHPVTPLLALLAAVTLTEWGSASRRQAFQRTLPLLIAGAFLLAGSRWILDPAPKMPPERTYASLPQDARVLDARFGDVVLRGWRSLSGWETPVQEWAQQGDAYAVELFWQVLQPVTIEYQFNLRYQQADGVQAEASRPLGAVSFPPFPTIRWDPATIYGEIVSLRFDPDISGVQSGQIRLGVWYWDSEGLIVNVPFSPESVDIALHAFAVYEPQPHTEPLPAEALVFGEQIALLALDVPDTTRAGESVTLRFDWVALSDVTRDLRLFLHLQDANGTLVAQQDGLPVPDLFTQIWMPGYRFSGEITLQMPAIAGDYALYGGLYDSAGRMTVAAPDNRPLLATLSVE